MFLSSDCTSFQLEIMSPVNCAWPVVEWEGCAQGLPDVSDHTTALEQHTVWGKDQGPHSSWTRRLIYSFLVYSMEADKTFCGVWPGPTVTCLNLLRRRARRSPMP